MHQAAEAPSSHSSGIEVEYANIIGPGPSNAPPTASRQRVSSASVNGAVGCEGDGIK